MITIDGREIGANHKPYIVAELSANHGGSIEAAKLAISEAARAGANAVKLQTYTPDTITLNSDKPDFIVRGGLWDGSILYDLYKDAYTPYEWHQALFEHAARCGITIFSSPFDSTAVDLLEKLDSPAFKIASFELIDLPLIELVARTKKPILMSTGMADLAEVSEALEVAKKYGSGEVLLFHCVSSYPADLSDSNLANIRLLKREFDVEIGLSDHTLSNLAAIVAVSLGAVAIEKHFKPKNGCGGPDESFSILPDQLADLVKDCNSAWQAVGKEGFTRAPTELEFKKYRRSLYFISNLKKGQLITHADIRSVRPGFGLPPKYYEQLIGNIVTRDVELGDAVTWDLVEFLEPGKAT
jgi:pseudaminic acid synthase